MKRTFLLFTFLFVTVCGVYAQNDDSAPKISAGFSLGATVGPHSGDFPVASGVHLKLEYPVSDSQLALMLTVGYTFYVSSNGYSTGYYTGSGGSGSYSNGALVSFVPVETGVRYYVVSKLFVQGDAGVSFNINSSTSDYTNKKVALIVSPSAGYAIPFGRSKFALDLSLGYEARLENTGGASQAGYALGSYNQVVFRAAFKIGL